ncbi:hypothetical protein A5671_13930 [Mycolicibacter heraklionensis]|nr:hypothetical protein A5671_13930 [Mycolicibacter heraklionensis]
MIEVGTRHFKTFGGRRYQRGNGVRIWFPANSFVHEPSDQGVRLYPIGAEEHEKVRPGNRTKTASATVGRLLLRGIPIDVGGVPYPSFTEAPSAVDNHFSFRDSACFLPVGQYI